MVWVGQPFTSGNERQSSNQNQRRASDDDDVRWPTVVICCHFWRKICTKHHEHQKGGPCDQRPGGHFNGDIRRTARADTAGYALNVLFPGRRPVKVNPAALADRAQSVMRVCIRLTSNGDPHVAMATNRCGNSAPPCELG